MGKVLPFHGPVLFDGEPLEGEDLSAAFERRFRDAIRVLRLNGYRRFRLEVRVSGVDPKPKKPARRPLVRR